MNDILRFTLASLVVDSIKASVPESEQQSALRGLIVFLLVLYTSRAAKTAARQNGAVLESSLDAIVADLQSIVTDALSEAKDMFLAIEAENKAQAPNSSIN